ncbi:MAG: hypothetical protein V7K61_00130 [Nostoc sp.]
MHKVHSESAIALTPKFSRRSDRSYKVHCKAAMSTMGYANALTKVTTNLNF